MDALTNGTVPKGTAFGADAVLNVVSVGNYRIGAEDFEILANLKTTVVLEGEDTHPPYLVVSRTTRDEEPVVHIGGYQISAADWKRILALKLKRRGAKK